MGISKKPRIPCPNCGYMNRPRAVTCSLCGELMVQKGERKIGAHESLVKEAIATPSAPITPSAEAPVPSPAPEAPVKAQAPPPSPGVDAMAFAGGQPGSGLAKAGPAQRTTFYREKDKNIRNSYMILFFMVLLLTLLGATMGGVYGDPSIGAGVAFVIALLMGLWSWRSGANMVLYMSGAKKVTRDDELQLFNIVEEMKIASGLPMPEIYVIESSAPNAFATGRDPDRSAVAVTRGLMDKLNREELQGVIAHEMAHIGNYDIRYAMLAAVLAGAIALISDAFLRGGGRRVGPRGGNPILLLIAILLAILAPISALLLQMAVSRKRELLADATAVQFTRNPEGLASALAKIALDPDPLEGANRATQHMYIINPLKSFSMSSGAMMSTHPPTEARINALRNMGANI